MQKDKFSLRTICRNLLGLLLLFGWVYMAAQLTLFSRSRTPQPTVNFDLFWSVSSAWKNQDAGDWYFVIGNIVMFIPLGWILPSFFVHARNYYIVVFLGFCSSFVIEMIQLVEHLGLCELDDLFHNTLGCALGYGIFVFVMWIWKKESTSMLDKAAAVLLWAGVLGFFSAAYALGQPLFDAFSFEKMKEIFSNF